jgi:hypothetical protein
MCLGSHAQTSTKYIDLLTSREYAAGAMATLQELLAISKSSVKPANAHFGRADDDTCTPTPKQVHMLVRAIGLYPDHPDLTMTGTRGTRLQHCPLFSNFTRNRECLKPLPHTLQHYSVADSSGQADLHFYLHAHSTYLRPASHMHFRTCRCLQRLGHSIRTRQAGSDREHMRRLW